MNEYTYNFQKELYGLFEEYDFLLDDKYGFTRAEFGKALDKDCVKRLGKTKSFFSFSIPFSKDVIGHLKDKFVTTSVETIQNGMLGYFAIFQDGEVSYVFGFHSFEKNGINVCMPVFIFADSLRAVFAAYRGIKQFEDGSILPFLKDKNKKTGFSL